MGYISLGVARADAPPQVRDGVRQFDLQMSQATFSAVSRAKGSPRDAALISTAIKAMGLVLARLLADSNARERGVCVVGVPDLSAELVVRALTSIGLTVVAIATTDPRVAPWHGLPVMSLEESISLRPGAYIAIDAESEDRLRRSGVQAMLSFTGRPAVAPCDHGPIVVDQDHDSYFTQELLVGIAPSETNDALERQALHVALAWDGTRLVGWIVVGQQVTIRRFDGSMAVEVVNSSDLTASLFQRLSLPLSADPAKPRSRSFGIGAWVKTDTAALARVQVAWPGAPDQVSTYHPGDGRWHYLGFSAEVGATVTDVDLYLQLVQAGTASFRDVRADVGERVADMTAHRAVGG